MKENHDENTNLKKNIWNVDNLKIQFNNNDISDFPKSENSNSLDKAMILPNQSYLSFIENKQIFEQSKLKKYHNTILTNRCTGFGSHNFRIKNSNLIDNSNNYLNVNVPECDFIYKFILKEEKKNDVKFPMKISNSLNFSKWKKLKSTKLPSPRNAHSSTVIDKLIFIFGGHYKNNHLNDLIIFDSVNIQWIIPKIKGNIPSGIRGHTSSFILNNIFIFGGYDGKNRVNDLYRFSIDNFSFVKIPNNRETIFPRQRHTANISNNKILFFGGFQGDNKWINNMDMLNVDQLESYLLRENAKVNLKNDFHGTMLNNQEFSDITFIFNNNQKIYSHKAILSTRVEYFKNMFSDHMLEKNFHEIKVNDYDNDIYFQFLYFVYTSEIQKTNYQILLALFKLSDHYSYEPLKKKCETAILLMLNLVNVVEITIISYKCNSNILEDHCIDFILKNRNEKTLQKDMYNLIQYPNLMTKIMKQIGNF